MIDIGIFATTLAGNRLDFPTWRARDVQWGSGEHGYEEFSCTIPCSLVQAYFLYAYQGALFVRVIADGVRIWEGRLEKPILSNAGVQLVAYGAWRALSDVPYTALWTTTDLTQWRPVLNTELASRSPMQNRFSTQNYLEIAPQKGETMNANTAGSLTMETPSGGAKTIIGVQFRYRFLAPVGWQCDLGRFSRTFTGGVALFADVGTGVLKTGALNLTFTGVDRLIFSLYYNAVAAIYAGETGAAYFQVYDLRVVTATTNRINTTLTANRVAGVNVTATVGSTARMYVGQLLIINSPNVISEIVTVISIGSATQFNATFVQNYVIGNAVQAMVIYADEIVKDMIATVNTVNTAQLSSSTALVQSPAIDILDSLYQDAQVQTAITDLMPQGDSSSRYWEAGVFDNQAVYFRPRGSAGQTWYVDATSLEVIRTLEALFNSAYSVYQDVSGGTVRGAVSSDTASIAKYGFTRRQAVPTSTTSLVQANIARDTAIAQQKEVTPQSSVTFKAVYTASGSRGRLRDVRSGDTFILRNLPPNLGTDIDKIRRFVLAETTYNPEADTLEVVPETPRPTIDVLLATPL